MANDPKYMVTCAFTTATPEQGIAWNIFSKVDSPESHPERDGMMGI